MIFSTGSSTAAPAATGNAAKETVIGSDLNTFLRMLTTQMQHQDPLNPMDSSDFAVQLATFSGVEQQAQTNKLLQEMMTRIGSTALGQFADWIGKEARTTQPVWFGQQPLSLDLAPNRMADSVVLVTVDAQGHEVLREEIPPGAGMSDWFGQDANGNKLPDGRYYFRTESYLDGQILSDEAVGVYSRITGAETRPDGVTLVLQGGASIAADAVQALRDPP